MKLRTFLSSLTMVALFATSLVMAVSQPHPFGDGPSDKTLAPQFQVIGADSGQEVLPLKATEVKVGIAGVIAEVTVEQVYQNTGKAPIEAIYIFPASTRAAVHGVEMRIGQRIIRSKIQENQQAKATYEKAKAEKKTASLLEEKRPNVFQMSVANILPGDEVRVTLRYSERLSASNRVYEFIFPTVVGPRYSNGSPAPEQWAQNPYLAEGSRPASSFALHLDLHAGMPLQSVTLPSHDGKIEFRGKDAARIALPASGEHGNRDFVLRYQLAGQQVASGLLLHQADEGNFFLLNVQPPARVQPEQIPPRDYVFILDVSGSMGGFPLDTAKLLMRNLLGGLKPSDSFNLMLFAGGSDVLSGTSISASPANIKKALGMVGQSRGGGGTELLPALRRALALPQADGVSRSIVVVTDGYITLEREAFQLVRQELNQANLFAFGIGTAVNRWLIEGLARAGGGEPFVVLNPSDATLAAIRFQEYVSAPVLTDIEVRYEAFGASDVLPTSLPDVFADRPIEIMGKWQGPATGRIVVTGKTGGAPYEATFDINSEAGRGLSNPPLRPLWALEKVRALTDDAMLHETEESIKEITRLGLAFELLTKHTSFVGVDESPREILADASTVQQPLPLPQGVENSAASGNQQVVISHQATSHSGAVPEPGVAGLLILTAASLLLHRRRAGAGNARA